MSSACLLPLQRTITIGFRNREICDNAWVLSVLQEFGERLWNCRVNEVMGVPMGPIYPESGKHVAPTSLLWNVRTRSVHIWRKVALTHCESRSQQGAPLEASQAVHALSSPGHSELRISSLGVEKWWLEKDRIENEASPVSTYLFSSAFCGAWCMMLSR